MHVHAPIVLLLACLACSCTRETETRAPAKSEAALLKRQEKDKVFKHGPGSPLPEEEKARFQGLAYYQVNPAYRFKVTLHRYPDPEIVRFATNTEERRQFLRYGYFEFEIQGQKCRLQVYRATDEGEEAMLFIPFRDATSGKETYGGGRYLDLKENTSGGYELDFNEAYNPYCAYGKNYSCPLPPRDNTLPVPVPVGEKNYTPPQ